MAVFTLGNLASVLAPSYGTLMVARFVAGLPHGAFFGVAALIEDLRTQVPNLEAIDMTPIVDIKPVLEARVER